MEDIMVTFRPSDVGYPYFGLNEEVIIGRGNCQHGDAKPETTLALLNREVLQEKEMLAFIGDDVTSLRMRIQRLYVSLCKQAGIPGTDVPGWAEKHFQDYPELARQAYGTEIDAVWRKYRMAESWVPYGMAETKDC
jgi:hypothetical protein